MRALVYAGKNRMVLRTLPTPTPAPDEVLLRIRSVGICGTDLHIANGGTDVQPGTVIGHEFSGVVAAVGEHIRAFRVGERVVAEHVVNCQTCPQCMHGKPNLCERAQVLGMHLPGALAEYMTVPARLVYRIPARLPDDEAALIEPLTIALYAASQAGFLLEQRVAVVGQGPIGILLDQVLTAAGAHVVGIDAQRNRLAFARRNRWVRAVLNPTARSFRKELARALPGGADACFEAVGKSVTAELCLEITRRDGNIFFLGVFEKATSLNLMHLVKKELNVFGSWTCSFSFPRAIELVAERSVHLAKLITHRSPLAKAPQAFRDAARYAGNRMKTVIHVSTEG